jgi:hypothetical protein
MTPSIREWQSNHKFTEDIKEEDIFVPGQTKTEPPSGGKGGRDENDKDDGDFDGIRDLTIRGQCHSEVDSRGDHETRGEPI